MCAGTCLAGFLGCTTPGGAGEYAGMRYYFSGDDAVAPVVESIELLTKSTVWTYFYVSAYRAGLATVSCRAIRHKKDLGANDGGTHAKIRTIP